MVNGRNIFERYPVTIAAIAICCIVYVFQMMNPNLLYQFGLYSGPLSGQEFYRIITYAFLHGNLQHILFNMMAVYNIGTFVEDYFKSGKYLAVSLVSLLTSGLAVVFLGNPRSITVGYSGVIFGLFGAFVSIMIRTGAIRNDSVATMIARMLLPNIVISLMPGVSWQGHLGGFIGGFITAWILGRGK